jgi:beta-glucosidase
MRLPTRSELDPFVRRGDFFWATGIEDTFITDPWPATGRTLDEYELTQHYEHCAEDLARVARLGVGAVRYGIPWHRIEPQPGVFEFDFPDEALGRLFDVGVAPIVDLIHYGVPRWLEGAFLNPDYPQRVAAFAAAVAERYRGRIHWYTPINEPRITAWYCGRLGWWPPYARGWNGFAQVLLALCRGVRATQAALHAVDLEIVVAHVDASDVYDTDEPDLRDETERRQQIVFLALDLLCGRVASGHPLYGWLRSLGIPETELAAFRDAPLAPDLIGINLYPMFTHKRLVRRGGRLRTRMQHAGPDLLERVATSYFAHFGRPLWISETASVGSIGRRSAWMDGSIEAVRALRARSVPVVGYTWWPLFSLVGWAYRQGSRPLARNILHMGLWDLHPEGTRLARVETPLVDRFARFAKGGIRSAGAMEVSLP